MGWLRGQRRELLQEPGPQPLRGAHFPEEGHHLPPPWSAKREQRQLLGGPGPYLMGSFMTLRVVTGITTLSLSEVTFPSLSFFRTCMVGLRHLF